MQDSLNESSVRPNGTPVMPILLSRKTQKFIKLFLRFQRPCGSKKSPLERRGTPIASVLVTKSSGSLPPKHFRLFGGDLSSYGGVHLICCTFSYQNKILPVGGKSLKLRGCPGWRARSVRTVPTDRRFRPAVGSQNLNGQRQMKTKNTTCPSGAFFRGSSSKCCRRPVRHNEAST